MTTDNENAEPTAPETAPAADDDGGDLSEDQLLQAAIAAAHEPDPDDDEGDDGQQAAPGPEPEKKPDPEKPEAEAETDVELDPKLQEHAKQQAQLRAAREAQERTDAALTKREQQLEARMASIESRMVSQAEAAKDPLAALAKLTGEDPTAVYQRMSYQIATGKPKEADSQTQLAQQFKSFQEDMVKWRDEQQTAQQKAEEEADEAQVKAGILDIINDGDYAVSKKVGVEQVRDHLFGVVKRTWKQTGRAPNVRELLTKFEENATSDWLAIAKNADDDFLKKAGLTRIDAEPEQQPRAEGDRTEGSDTLTNSMAGDGAPSLTEEDDSYYDDDDAVLQRAIAAAKHP